MPNLKSAIKRARQNEKRRMRNMQAKSTLNTTIRRVQKAIETGDREQAAEELIKASSAIDKAVSKGFIHKNTSARKKSRLARKVNLLMD